MKSQSVTNEEKPTPLEAARALLAEERQACIDAVGKALADVLEDHRAELVVIPGDPVVLPDGSTVTPLGKPGFRLLD